MSEKIEKPGITKKVLSIILVVLLIFPLIGSAIILPVEKILLNKGTYINAFDESKIYENLPAYVASLVQNFELRGITGTSLEDLFAPPTTKETIAEILKQFIDGTWVRSQLEGLIDNILDYIKGDQKDLSLMIDLTSFKMQFEGTTALENFTTAILSIRPCKETGDEAEIALISEFTVSGTLSKIPNCRPAELMENSPIVSQIAMVLRQQTQSYIEHFEDSIDLVAFTNSGKEQNGNRTESVLINLRTCRLLLIISPIITVILICTLVLMYRKQIRDLFSWLGIPMMIAGLVGMLINLILFFLLNGLLGRYSSQFSLNAPHDFSSAVIDIIYRIGNEYILYAGYATLGILIIGLLFYLGARFMKGKAVQVKK